MPEANSHRLYRRTEFVALASGPVPEPLLKAQLAELTLTAPIVAAEVLPTGDVAISFAGYPTEADVDALDQFVAEFEGGETSSAPIELNSFAVATATDTPVEKIHTVTPPLEAGTYQVIWTSSLRMQAIAANTGVEGKIRLERSDGVAVEQTDAWDLNVRHAFNGVITFVVQAGQTITATLSFSRLGASGTAEMSGARVTIDKLS